MRIRSSVRRRSLLSTRIQSLCIRFGGGWTESNETSSMHCSMYWDSARAPRHSGAVEAKREGSSEGEGCVRNRSGKSAAALCCAIVCEMAQLYVQQNR
jgi:hypothetical protein